jgi:ABC-type transporter Mla MlaB component
MASIVLEFAGRLTVKEAMQTLGLQQQRLQQTSSVAETSIIGDLSKITDVDTSALAVMLHLDRECRKRFAKPVRWRGTPANLISLAGLSSLTDVFEWENGAAP